MCGSRTCKNRLTKHYKIVHNRAKLFGFEIMSCPECHSAPEAHRTDPLLERANQIEFALVVDWFAYWVICEHQENCHGVSSETV